VKIIDIFLGHFQTILAKIMWTPNFSNANINIETFFHEICRPLFNVVSRIQILKVSFTNIELGVGGGEIFWGINSVEIDLFLFDARGVHDNFCQDCRLYTFQARSHTARQKLF
jgi:hypothetical protein